MSWTEGIEIYDMLWNVLCLRVFGRYKIFQGGVPPQKNVWCLI